MTSRAVPCPMPLLAEPLYTATAYQHTDPVLTHAHTYNLSTVAFAPALPREVRMEVAKTKTAMEMRLDGE